MPTYIEPKEKSQNLPLRPTAGGASSYGVPTDWLDDLVSADEDQLLELADHLPAEAAEAILELAVGSTPTVVQADCTN